LCFFVIAVQRALARSLRFLVASAQNEKFGELRCKLARQRRADISSVPPPKAENLADFTAA